jgi:hypothetical protein
MAAKRKDHCGRCGRSKINEPERFRLTRRGVGQPYALHFVCRPCELTKEAENREHHARRKAAGETGECCEPDCARPVHAGGQCRPHYDKARREADERHCDVRGCTGRPNARGLCNNHLYRLYRYGDALTVVRSYAAKGSGTVTADGYRLIRVDGQQVREHRWVMERKLGRALFEHENVHHVNGQRADNRLSNLELWSTSQPSGQRVEQKLAWAQEFLAQYLDREELRTWVEGLGDDGNHGAPGTEP